MSTPAALSLEAYHRDVSRSPLLTRDQEIRLGLAVQNAAASAKMRAKARELLIRSNLRLVFSVAKRYTGKGLDLPDLVQEGTCGLMRAAELYDPERGTKFGTFAVHWIRQAIQMCVKEHGRTVRVPAYQWEQSSLWEKAAHELYLETGDPPPEEAVLERMRVKKGSRNLDALTLRDGRRALRALTLPLSSLGKRHADWDGHSEAPCYVPDYREQAARDWVASQERLGEVYAALARLTEQERTVVRLRFGLGGNEPLLLKEVGQRMGGYTRERIRQIERDALDKLKVALGRPVPPREPRKRRKAVVA